MNILLQVHTGHIQMFDINTPRDQQVQKKAIKKVQMDHKSSLIWIKH